jgi:hypothetical protein
VHENLCIASSAENVASAFELMTELGMVENTTRGYKDHQTIFVCQGLPTAFNVDDAQPDMREADPLAGIESVTIGSPVLYRGRHAPQ